MLADADFAPFDPPAQPSVRKLYRNYVETYPRELYETPTARRFRSIFSDSLVVTDPAIIHDVLVTRADQFVRDRIGRRLLYPMLGDRSILTAEGADWRWQRRAVAPAFRHERLLELVPIMEAAAARQVARWRQRASDGPVDASDAMTQTTFEIMAETLFGGAESLDPLGYSRALTADLSSIPWRIMVAFFHLPEWTPFPGRAQAVRARKNLLSRIERFVAERRGRAGNGDGLFDLLASAHDPESDRGMTDEELVRNLATFLNAGHETTAVALTWTLWLLAKDPESQSRVLAEVRAAAGDAPIAAEHVDQLSFTWQVVQESMRLYSPVPAMSRSPRVPVEVAGEQLDPRSTIDIPIWVIHRNRGLWDNPESFDPDRFSPERSKGRARHAFMPFGAGPRICIGASFSKIEAVVILASLVRAFLLKPVDGYRPYPLARVSLRPAEGMPLQLETRH